MLPLDDILSISSEAGFRRAAMELFVFQSRECAPYREYIRLLGLDAERIKTLEEIPFLPIGLWRSHRVYCGAAQPEIVFTSSTTGGAEPSRHHMASLEDYRATFRRAFELFHPGRRSIYALLPSYLQRTGSSLVCMADDLIKRGGGGFYLDDYDALLRDMAACPGEKILLGVSYALWELAEQRPGPLPEGTVVMETGGMKGRREELPREEFHVLLCCALGVERIASEYGMAELSSQSYSAGEGLFRTPPWMRVSVRDVNDPSARLEAGRSGGLDIIDLANRYSCAFVQTDDVGRVWPDGGFEIQGRIDHSVTRGCNLLIQ